MKGLGDKLLAGAGFAGDKDGRVGLRDLSDGLVDLLHGRGIADDPLRLHERADLVTQNLDLAGQVPVLDDALHGMADLVELEWLGDVVVRDENCPLSHFPYASFPRGLWITYCKTIPRAAGPFCVPVTVHVKPSLAWTTPYGRRSGNVADGGDEGTYDCTYKRHRPANRD